MMIAARASYVCSLLCTNSPIVTQAAKTREIKHEFLHDRPNLANGRKK